MKIYYSFAFLIFICSSLFGQSKFENTIIQFDTVYQGQTTSKIIKIENISDKTVKIDTIISSIGYLTQNWEKKDVLPNDEFIIEFYCYTLEMSEQNVLHTTIYFSDGTEQKITFLIYVRPSLINFSAINLNPKYDKNNRIYQFEIRNTGDSLIYLYISVHKTPYYDKHSYDLSIDKKILKKDETAKITLKFYKDIFYRPEDETSNKHLFDAFHIFVDVEDCLKLTKKYTGFIIEK